MLSFPLLFVGFDVLRFPFGLSGRGVPSLSLSGRGVLSLFVFSLRMGVRFPLPPPFSLVFFVHAPVRDLFFRSILFSPPALLLASLVGLRHHYSLYVLSFDT